MEKKEVVKVPVGLMTGMLLIASDETEVEVSVDFLEEIGKQLDELENDETTAFYRRQINILTT